MPLKLIEKTIGRSAGLLGGLIWAGFISLVLLYGCGLFRYHIVWALAAFLVATPVLSFAGWLRPGYLGQFSIPFLMLLSDTEQNDMRWRTWLACLLFLSFPVTLAIGSLFQVHAAAAFGILSFFVYALMAPCLASKGD